MSERPHEWSREDVVALLEQVDLFEGLSNEDLNAIAAIVGGRAVAPVFANAEREQACGEDSRTDAFAVSRVMQAGLLPQVEPKVDGHDIAAGTTTEEDGRGASGWDWIELADGRTALLSVDVTQDGFPPAHHLGTSRAVVRAVAVATSSVAGLLRGSNEALAAAGVDGLDQFGQMGVLVVDADGLQWGSAGNSGTTTLSGEREQWQ